MFRTAILILTLLRVLLVGGMETGKTVDNKTEIDSNLSKRMMFGQLGEAEEFPYLVRIQLLTALCGGSIIANHWILTAAHCVYKEPCKKIKLLPAAWKSSETFAPDACFYHEQYKSNRHEYDIGLMRVKKVLLDSRTKIIKLPPPNQVYPPGKVVTIAGWGLTQDHKNPGTLLRATVHLTELDKCAKYYLFHHPDKTEGPPKRILCVEGDGAYPSNICLGDSGGPAATSDGVVIGVASFVFTFKGFCVAGPPSIFLNVVDYLPWIYKHIDPEKDTSKYRIRPEHKIIRNRVQ